MEQSGGDVDLGIVGVGPGTLIGLGGSAKVYRAHQEHLDRDVAVKIIAAYGDAAIQRRFERERRAMGRLSSVGGILTVYDAGINAAGDLYLVMPLERGGSFKDRIDAHGPLRWDEACYVMEQVAEAIEEAHQQGIVHRDIKPGNILISSSGRPLIADFGIARPMLDAGLTSTAMAMTPAYSPPEAFDNTDSGAALDVYALGATLWALLVGRAPFTDSDTPTPLGSIVARVANHRPGDLSPVAPQPVCQIVEVAMAKEPADRQPSAAAFAAVLRRARLESTGFVAQPRPVIAAARPMHELPFAQQPSQSPPTLFVPSVPVAPTSVFAGANPPPTVTPSVTRPAPETSAHFTSAQPTNDGSTKGSTSSGTLVGVAVLLVVLLVGGIAAFVFLGDDADDAVATVGADDGEGSDVGGDDVAESDVEAEPGTTDPAPVVAPTPEPTPTSPPVLEPFAIPTPTVTPVPTPSDEDLLRTRGYTDRSRAPVIGCSGAETGITSTVTTATGDGLNIRSEPGEDGDVILEFADEHEVFVLTSLESADLGDGDIWVIVELPATDDATVACGWASARFLSSPGFDNLAQELRPRNTDGSIVPGSAFRSSCTSGWSPIVAGTTFDGRFDVRICVNGRGRLEYHGGFTDTGDNIRLSACRSRPGAYRAFNAGFEYRVIDGRTAAGGSSLEVIGPDAYFESLVNVAGNASAAGVDAC